MLHLKSFISSAYWTENIGYAAAIAAIKYMKKNKVSSKLRLKVKKIKKIWSELGKENRLQY